MTLPRGAPHPILEQHFRISSVISTDKGIHSRVCMHMYYTVTDPANDFIVRWRELPHPAGVHCGGALHDVMSRCRDRMEALS